MASCQEPGGSQDNAGVWIAATPRVEEQNLWEERHGSVEEQILGGTTWICGVPFFVDVVEVEPCILLLDDIAFLKKTSDEP